MMPSRAMSTKKGQAARKFVIYVWEAMNDDFRRCLEMLGDGKLLCQVFIDLQPDVVFLCKAVDVDDGQKIVVGAIATVAIFNPVTPGIGAEQDQLQNSSRPRLFGKFGLL